MSDPRFDLANFSVNHDFGVDEDRGQVRLYHGHPDQHVIAAVRVLPPGLDRCQSDDQRRVVARLALARGRLPLVPIDRCGGAARGDRRGA